MDRFIRVSELEKILGLSKSTIYRLEKSGDLPRKRYVTEKTVAWVESEIDEWIVSRSEVVEENEKKRDPKTI